MRRRLLPMSITVLGLLVGLAPAAGAVGTGGSAPFAMAPSPQKGQTSSYFQLNMQAGMSKTEAVVISDAGRNPETLKLGVSHGVTAPNTGVAYAGAYHACAETACWVHGLPSEVRLAAGQTKKISFTVVVPVGTPDKQYLAGITAQPTSSGRSVVVGQNGAATARAVIVDQITIGLAITVGPYASLRSALAIPNVKATAVGKTPRLLVFVYNTGQRFTSATGTAVCTTRGHRHSYVVLANTILPGDSAVVDVNAPGLPAYSINRCEVNLPFATRNARWVGTVKVPSLKVPRTVHNHKGQYTQVPGAIFPTWAIAVMAGGGAFILILLTTFLFVMRRYRRRLKLASTSAE